MICSVDTVQELSAVKGEYRGLCHNDECLSSGAKFLHRLVNAYYCRDCAYSIHKSVKSRIGSVNQRLVEFRDDQPGKFVSVNTAKTSEDRELLYNRRTEMRMASEWYRWNHKRSIP